MTFKTQRQREKLAKKAKRGFRGYPVATAAYYGPTNDRASKVAVGIVMNEGSEPEPMQKWLSESADVRHESEIIERILQFLAANNVKSVVVAEGIMGCPHEEGIDCPEGEWCPECPYWRNRDRFSGEVLQ